MRKRIALFCSGSGTNAEALMAHFASDDVIEVGLMVVNKVGIKAIERANNYGVPVHSVTTDTWRTPELLLGVLSEYNIDYLILAGFLWKIPVEFINQFPDRIINIHPSLLPKYGGKGMYGHHVHQAVLENKEMQSGITIHVVNAEYDKGRILLQASCLVAVDADTADTLAARIHKLEHLYYKYVVAHYILNS